MSETTVLYSLADPVFHEDFALWRAEATRLGVDAHRLPEGWECVPSGNWVSVRDTTNPGPEQGWKIHVAATRQNCEQILEVVSGDCLAHRVPFKFLATAQLVTVMNSKYAPRSSSGKFMTIYPRDDTQMGDCLNRLGDRLDGFVGPYILTDCRWGNGPLYFRYGAFKLQRCWTADGERVFALRGPAGELVPDDRAPTFSVPAWVTPPEVLRPHIEKRSQPAGDLGFTVTEALGFSNAGGVYAGVRNGDEQSVVIKEARPLTGGRNDGSEAVDRLRGEDRVLRILDDVVGVPRSYGIASVWEHEFLVMERRFGTLLQHWMVRNNPLANWDAFTPDGLADYTHRAERLWSAVRDLVGRVHERGVVYGDVHPQNILVESEDDGRMAIVDFEQSYVESEGAAGLMGASGFIAPEKTGFALDRHGLAVLRLWMYLPVTSLLGICRDHAEPLIREVEQHFPVPADFGDHVRGQVLDGSWKPRGPVGLPRYADVRGDAAGDDTQRSIAEAIRVTATPERRDRLFPGDTQQFVIPAPAGFAHGAAGVLWALWTTLGQRDHHHEKWLLERCRAPQSRAGFYDGAHGTAYVLHALGHTERAAELIDGCAGLVRESGDTTLSSGLAGVGLDLVAGAGGGSHGPWAADLADITGRLHRVVDAEDNGVLPPGGRFANGGAGLLHGWSGIALFFLTMYQADGAPTHWDAAVRALHRDLDLCAEGPQGSLLVPDGPRLLPYLGVGSAGIAVVARRLLDLGDDERTHASLPALARALRAPLVVGSGLVSGRAGLLAAADALGPAIFDLEVDPVAEHVANLHWHALGYRGHVAFPGLGGLKFSMDLATGNAGVLLALSSVSTGRHPVLPFLSPSPGSPPFARTDSATDRWRRPD